MDSEDSGTLESRDDVPSIKYWLGELDLAEDREEQWRKDAKEAIKIYRSENFNEANGEKSRKETFNILWANTETIRPALYSTPPKPDVRRRFKHEDPLGRHIAEIMERAATFSVDADDFDTAMIAAVNDSQLPGRGVTRVVYDPEVTDDDVILSQELRYEQVQWDDFLHGPGNKWSEVPWIAFRHKLTKDDVEDQFPKFKDKLNYISEAAKDKTDEESLKRVDIWEIFDRTKREVLFVSTDYKDSVLKTVEDPLGLDQFYPIPEPLKPIESSTSLIPVTEYSMYETLAKELETLTNRIRRIIAALRVRGIYDSSMDEIRKIFDSADNQMIPAENLSRLLEGRGLESAIWMFPNDSLAAVLGQLYQYRDQLMAQIYEVTGISDIIRGASDPRETLGAQRIKADYGGQRLKRKQRDVQRYARDLIRLTVEIMAEHYEPEALEKITGLDYPTQMEKQQAQMQMQMMAQQAQAQAQQQAMMAQQQQQLAQQQPPGQPQQQPPPQQPPQQPQPPQPPEMPPEMQAMMAKPTWEELQAVLRDDHMRSYRVDIETDTTIMVDQEKDQENIAALVTGIGQFTQALGPAVQSGTLSLESGKTLMLSMIRRFKLGRDVEEALEAEFDQPAPPDPEAKKGEIEAQKAQADMQYKMQMLEAEKARDQAQNQTRMQEMQAKTQMEMQRLKQDMELKQQKMQIDVEYKKQQIDLERREMELKTRETAVKEYEAQIDAKKVEQDGVAKIAQFRLEGRKLHANDHR